MKHCEREGTRWRLPYGLIGTLVLIVLVERSCFHGKTCLTSSHAASWKYTDRHLAKQVKDRNVLCLGDSLMKFGVLPTLLEAHSGLSAYNLAMFASPTPASYFVFRRALEAGARPKAILLESAAGLLLEGPSSTVRPYSWAELLRLRESLELAWVTSDPNLLADILVRQTLHSYRMRHEIRAYVRNALAGRQNHQAMILAILQHNWNRNRGAQAQADVHFDDPLPPGGVGPSPSWQCNPVNELYLHKIFDLAARHQIPVYWFLPPYSPGELAAQNHRGENVLYDQFVARLQGQHENVVVLDGRDTGYDQSFFFDTAHLNRDGAIATTLAIGDLIWRAGEGFQTTPRWMKLANAQAGVRDELGGRIAIEDTAQSILAVKASASRAMRFE